YFPFAISRRPPFREDLIDLPVRELGGTSAIHLAVAGGGPIWPAVGVRRGGLGPPQGGGGSGGAAPARRPPPVLPPRAPPPRAAHRPTSGGGVTWRAARRAPGGGGPALP